MKRIFSLLVLAAMSLSLCGTALAAAPDPVTLDSPIEDVPVPIPWPAPPYAASLEDGAGDRQCLYLTENTDGAERFLAAVIDYASWTAYDQTGGAFRYDLDTGLLSVRSYRDGVPAYLPSMYVVDGESIGLEQMEGECTLTPEYSIEIRDAVDTKGKKTCVRAVRYDGVEYLEKDGLSMDGLRAVQDARRHAPGYGRLFPKDWSYEIRKADTKGLSVDLASRRTVFLVEESMDEFDGEELLDVLKATDRLRHVLLGKAGRKAGK